MVRQFSRETRCKMRPRPMAKCMYACEKSHVHNYARPTQVSMLPTTSEENQPPATTPGRGTTMRSGYTTTTAMHDIAKNHDNRSLNGNKMYWNGFWRSVILSCSRYLFPLNPAPFDGRQGTPCPNEGNMWSCLCPVYLPQHIDAYMILNDSLVTSTSLAGFKLMFI